MNILTDRCPDEIIVDGRSYKIITDWKDWVKFYCMLDDPDLRDRDREYIAMQYFTESEPIDSDEAMKALIKFASGEDMPQAGKSNKQAVTKKTACFSWLYDGAFVLSAFRQYYGIDLRTEKITFTTNADGSVTANGTATADASYNMVVALPQNTSFILSGCPSGGSASTYNIFAIETNSFTQAYRDTGNGAEFNTGSYTEWSFRIRVVNGQTVNDLTFYPMVRSASVSDSEYAPYMDDLQTQINELKAQIAALTGVATVNEEVINNE